MTNFLIILVGLAGGYALQKSGRVSASAAAGINAWILNIALPAVILKYVPQIRWTPEVFFPVTAPLIVLAGAWVFSRGAGRLFRWKHGERAAVFLTSGLGNTSFVGFPLILAFYGTGALSVGVLCDQVTFVLLATVGVGTAATVSATSAATGSSVAFTVFRRLVSFPPLLAFPVALLLPRLVDLSPLAPLFDALGSTLAPLAVFSVGLQLSFSQARRGGRALAAGLVYKLLVAPALVLAAALVLGIRGPAAQISVFEAAMAPMITAAVVASEYGLEVPLAQAMVGLGIPLSLGTVALWWLALGFLR